MFLYACFLLLFASAAQGLRRGQTASKDLNVTVCYDPTSQQLDTLTDPVSCPNVVAFANFTDMINETGWSFLEVITTRNHPDELQAYAAGVAEGQATASVIYDHWQNTVDGYCDKTPEYCRKLKSYLEKNIQWIKYQIKANKVDPYWRQVNLALLQLAGLQDGYFGAPILKPHTSISPFKFLMFQINGELEDLEHAFDRPEHLRKRIFGSGSCSAFIKPTKTDLLFSHVSWSSYNTMLRIQKLYRFAYTLTGEPESAPAPGNTFTMSSYPGTLMSIDDFYLTSAGLAVTETTIGNSNKTLWSFVRPSNTVMTWIRTLVATRLATSAAQWVDIFTQYNSGTYNNQWMVVDYKRFEPGRALPSNGLFFMLEQLPGYIKSEDLTSELRSQGYWPSYNAPYNKLIFNYSGATDSVKKYGDWFTYDRTPRALIFKRDHGNVKDMTSLFKLMRYNNYKVDPLSRCNCTPPYSAENAIAARCDLNPANGTYPFSSLGHRCHGATDVKATSYDLMKNLRFMSVAGPTHDDLPPFDWSKSDCGTSLSHMGQPDVWTFAPLARSWKNLGGLPPWY